MHEKQLNPNELARLTQVFSQPSDISFINLDESRHEQISVFIDNQGLQFYFAVPRNTSFTICTTVQNQDGYILLRQSLTDESVHLQCLMLPIRNFHDIKPVQVRVSQKLIDEILTEENKFFFTVLSTFTHSTPEPKQTLVTYGRKIKLLEYLLIVKNSSEITMPAPSDKSLIHTWMRRESSKFTRTLDDVKTSIFTMLGRPRDQFGQQLSEWAYECINYLVVNDTHALIILDIAKIAQQTKETELTGSTLTAQADIVCESIKDGNLMKLLLTLHRQSDREKIRSGLHEECFSMTDCPLIRIISFLKDHDVEDEPTYLTMVTAITQQFLTNSDKDELTIQRLRRLMSRVFIERELYSTTNQRFYEQLQFKLVEEWSHKDHFYDYLNHSGVLDIKDSELMRQINNYRYINPNPFNWRHEPKFDQKPKLDSGPNLSPPPIAQHKREIEQTHRRQSSDASSVLSISSKSSGSKDSRRS